MQNPSVSNAIHDYEDAGPDAKASVRLWLRLFSCVTLIEAEIGRRLRAHFDISLAKFDFMAQLYRSPDGTLTMSQLGRSLMVTGGNITGLTDRLAREGLVERIPHPSDRRSRVIGLSEKGRAAFETMAEVHEEWIRELMSGLGEDEQEHLMGQLGTLKDKALEMPGSKETAR